MVEGVVGPEGGGVVPGFQKVDGKLQHAPGYDVHLFALAGWRFPGEPLVGRELTMLRSVPPSIGDGKREDTVFEDFPPYSVQRFSVLLSSDKTRAVIEKVLAIEAPDESLLLFSNRLRQPVVIATKHFGDVVLDAALGRFQGKAKWNRKKIDLHFEKGDNDSISDALKTAEALWSDQAAWKRKVDDFAVQKLLPLKNDSWLEEGEAETTPKEFKSRITLTSITVAADGRFEFWCDDGDLFFGHLIEIRGNLSAGLTDAGIHG